METAIEWYHNEMVKFEKGNSEFFSSAAIYNHAFRMEKEQIEIAFDLGRDEVTSVFIMDGEDYYNKKFNQNK